MSHRHNGNMNVRTKGRTRTDLFKFGSIHRISGVIYPDLNGKSQEACRIKSVGHPNLDKSVFLVHFYLRKILICDDH
jgi:hypothetical protein